MDVKSALNQLTVLENLSRATKFRRLLYTPLKYVFAALFKKVIYPITGKELRWRVGLFWGEKITISLPSSTDIFLLGCKTDPSEIRLTKFLCGNLQIGNFFVDIGSHVGYYSMLSSFCVGATGKILSIEASPASFRLLKKNILKYPNIEAFSLALSDKEGTAEFFEFPAPYTEYNTMLPEQFEDRRWLKVEQRRKVSIKTMHGDKFLEPYSAAIKVIKIDVEGAEGMVIRGLKNYLEKASPVVVMEFLAEKRANAGHCEADSLLRSLGYSAHKIGLNGELILLNVLANDHMEISVLESDNLVYCKQNPEV